MNKQYISFLIANNLLFIASISHAQVALSVGPSAGYNVATTNYQYATADGESYHVSAHSGLAIGIQAQASRGHVAVQPALLYSQKGFNLVRTTMGGNGDQYTSTTKYRLNYLTLPLNLVYTTGSTGQGFEASAGPYISALIGGNYQFSSELVATNAHFTSEGEGKVIASSEYKSSSASYPDYASRRFDAGVQAGIGYRYQEFLAQVGYSLGLRNVGAAYRSGTGMSAAPTYHNRAFQVSLSYLFDVKR